MSDGKFWMPITQGDRVFGWMRGDVCVPGAAAMRDSGLPLKYLVYESGAVRPMSQDERDVVDAAEAQAEQAAADANAAQAASDAQASEDAEAARIATLVAKHGGTVQCLQRYLLVLGHSLPCTVETVSADMIGRTVACALTADEREARIIVADVYALLQADGVSGADIEAIWAAVNTVNTEE